MYADEVRRMMRERLLGDYTDAIIPAIIEAAQLGRSELHVSQGCIMSSKTLLRLTELGYKVTYADGQRVWIVSWGL